VSAHTASTASSASPVAISASIPVHIALVLIPESTTAAPSALRPVVVAIAVPSAVVIVVFGVIAHFVRTAKGPSTGTIVVIEVSSASSTATPSPSGLVVSKFVALAVIVLVVVR